jgi:hypothetical protein
MKLTYIQEGHKHIRSLHTYRNLTKKFFTIYTMLANIHSHIHTSAFCLAAHYSHYHPKKKAFIHSYIHTYIHTHKTHVHLHFPSYNSPLITVTKKHAYIHTYIHTYRQTDRQTHMHLRFPSHNSPPIIVTTISPHTPIHTRSIHTLPHGTSRLRAIRPAFPK